MSHSNSAIIERLERIKTKSISNSIAKSKEFESIGYRTIHMLPK
jgi:hypothetical protein